MNIFALDRDPQLCARFHNDKHLIKMILEHCQLLSTTVHVLGGDGSGIYKVTHKNHPSALWTRTSRANYDWLIETTSHMLEIYSVWRGRQHACAPILERLKELSPTLVFPREFMTEFAQAMPDECKHPDPIQAYRRYYVMKKDAFCDWTHSTPPYWYGEMHHRFYSTGSF